MVAQDFSGKTVVVMAGGTGGHVYPALALALALSARGARVHWLGNADGFEASRVRAAGFELHDIAVRGLRGKGWRRGLSAPWMLGRAFWRAFQALRQVQADVVIGFGGFVSGPGGVAAKGLGMKLVVHEQNARMGLTNRLLAKVADKVWLADARAWSGDWKKAEVVGNPVREALVSVLAPEVRFAKRSGAIKWLIIGGSQGAAVLNECVPKALALLAHKERPEVVHQCGEGALEQTRARYTALGVEAEVVAFVEDMASAYAQCDWMLARSGALTVAEVATVGVAAVFVPFALAVDDHQTANAQTLVDSGAAECVAQAELVPERLAELIRAHNDRGRCLQRAKLARKHSQAGALERMLESLEGV